MKSARTGRDGAGRDEVGQVMDSIRRIVRLLRLGSRDAERQVGLTGAQLFILQKLAEAKMLSVNELGELTHTHQSSVSVVAQTLVDRGLVAKARAADDQRRLELTLTPAAKTLLRKAPGAAQDRLIDGIKHMPAPLRKQLAKGLERLVQETGADEGEATMIFEDEPSKGTSKRRFTSSRAGRK